jgi:Holliday junction DNA helicase RuvA
MIGFLKGRIDKIFDDKILIDVNNLGYEVYMCESEKNTLNKNDTIKLYTHLHLREDDLRLFGFLSYETLEFFLKLIGVSGVGPKVALGIISNISTNDICIAIATDNINTLKKVPGIGPKMAQKIIFELKDKIVKDQILDLKNIPNNTNIKLNQNVTEATTALQVLGYSQKEINEVIEKLDIKDNSVEDIIKKVLKEKQKI